MTFCKQDTEYIPILPEAVTKTHWSVIQNASELWGKLNLLLVALNQHLGDITHLAPQALLKE